MHTPLFFFGLRPAGVNGNLLAALGLRTSSRAPGWCGGLTLLGMATGRWPPRSGARTRRQTPALAPSCEPRAASFEPWASSGRRGHRLQARSSRHAARGSQTGRADTGISPLYPLQQSHEAQNTGPGNRSGTGNANSASSPAHPLPACGEGAGGRGPPRAAPLTPSFPLSACGEGESQRPSHAPPERLQGRNSAAARQNRYPLQRLGLWQK